MEMNKEHDEDLLPQEDFGTSRGRPGGAPDATRSVDQDVSSWHESCEGTAGVELASAPADQVVTGEGRCGEMKEDRERGKEKESLPRMKRKVLSPGEVGLAETRLRKRKERAKKVCVQDETPMDLTEDTSEEDDTEEWRPSTGRVSLKGKKNTGKKRADDTKEKGTGKMVGDEEIEEMELSTCEDKDKTTGSEREDNTGRASGVEALHAQEEEFIQSVEMTSTHVNQAQKAKQKKEVSEKELRDEGQIDLTRKEDDGEGLEMEETGKNRQKGIGKDRKIRGKKHEEKDEVELNGMMSQELREYAVMLLDDMEVVRLKSKNMQGTLSGILKDRINGLRGAIECLLDKLEVSGDVTYYKTKNNELTAENKRLKKEGERCEQEKRQKDKEIESYRDMYEDAESRYVEAEKRIRDKDRKKGEAVGGNVNTSELVRKEMTSGMKRMEDNYMTGMDTDVGRTEEEASRSESTEDSRWPAIRPSIRGRSKILTTARQIRNSAKARSDATTTMKRLEADEPPRIAAMRGSEMSTAPEKKRKISYTEEMERIDKQMRVLVEERELLREGKTSRNEKPRVISNVQIVPPREDARKIGRHNELQGEEWTKVSGRRREAGRRPGSDRTGAGRGDRSWSGNRLRKERAAVVAIRTKDDSVSYAEVLRKARQEISLGDLGIEMTRIKRGINGSLLIEVPGQESKEKARVLKDKLKEKLGESDVVITRPVAMAELRIFGFDESVITEELRDVVADYGNCTKEEVKVGEIRRTFNGLGMVWIRCPLAAARDVARGGRIRIGWTEARVEMLAKRPLQCFRCWEFGHVRLQCKAEVDRRGHCFRCGNQGHSVKECTSVVPRCVVCEEKGNLANHRIGSRFCAMSVNQGEGSGFTGRRMDMRGDNKGGGVGKRNVYSGGPRGREGGNEGRVNEMGRMDYDELRYSPN